MKTTATLTGVGSVTIVAINGDGSSILITFIDAGGNLRTRRHTIPLGQGEATWATGAVSVS